MINRTTMPVAGWTAQPADDAMGRPTSAPTAENLPAERPAPAIPIPTLLSILAALVLLAGLTSFYVWQMSKVSAINLQTKSLRSEIQGLEAENVTLMVQVAGYNSPQAIETAAHGRGMAPAKQPVYVQLPPVPAGEAGGSAAKPDQPKLLVTLWQMIIGRLR